MEGCEWRLRLSLSLSPSLSSLSVSLSSRSLSPPAPPPLSLSLSAPPLPSLSLSLSLSVRGAPLETVEPKSHRLSRGGGCGMLLPPLHTSLGFRVWGLGFA
jgi:hypothetical protein